MEENKKKRSIIRKIAMLLLKVVAVILMIVGIGTLVEPGQRNPKINTVQYYRNQYEENQRMSNVPLSPDIPLRSIEEGYGTNSERIRYLEMTVSELQGRIVEIEGDLRILEHYLTPEEVQVISSYTNMSPDPDRLEKAGISTDELNEVMKLFEKQ